MKHTFYLLAITILISSCTSGAYTLLSPDKTIKVDVVLPHGDNDNSLTYNIYKNEQLISEENTMGMKLASTDGLFYNNLRLLSFRQFYIDDLIDQPDGTPIRNKTNGIRFMLANTEGQNFNVVFRIYDEGVAFSYELFNEENDYLLADYSTFKIDSTQVATQLSPTAEFQFISGDPVSISSTADSLMINPILKVQHNVVSLDVSSYVGTSLSKNYHTSWRYLLFSHANASDILSFETKLTYDSEYAY